MPATSKSATEEMRTQLLRRRIVTRFCVNMQRRQTLRRQQLYLDLVPLAVTCWFVWTVSEHVLVAQLYSNLSGNIGQLTGIVNRERASSSDFRYFAEQRRPGRFLGRF